MRYFLPARFGESRQATTFDGPRDCSPRRLATVPLRRGDAAPLIDWSITRELFEVDAVSYKKGFNWYPSAERVTATHFTIGRDRGKARK
jgi:hypothetical protein